MHVSLTMAISCVLMSISLSTWCSSRLSCSLDILPEDQSTRGGWDITELGFCQRRGWDAESWYFYITHKHTDVTGTKCPHKDTLVPFSWLEHVANRPLKWHSFRWIISPQGRGSESVDWFADWPAVAPSSAVHAPARQGICRMRGKYFAHLGHLQIKTKLKLSEGRGRATYRSLKCPWDVWCGW